MENSATLYYFSTLAQCLAALAALPAIFVHFRTQVLVRLMVGLGKSMLLRWDREPDYIQRFVPSLGARQPLDRLKLEAAVERDDLKTIHRLIKHFHAVEQRLYHIEPPKGFAATRRYFEQLDRMRVALRDALIWSVVYALSGMGVALFGILAISFGADCYVSLAMFLSLIIGAVAVVQVALVVRQGMADQSEAILDMVSDTPSDNAG